MNFFHIYIPSTLGIEQDILHTVENADIKAADPIASIHGCYYRLLVGLGQSFFFHPAIFPSKARAFHQRVLSIDDVVSHPTTSATLACCTQSLHAQ